MLKIACFKNRQSSLFTYAKSQNNFTYGNGLYEYLYYNKIDN